MVGEQHKLFFFSSQVLFRLAIGVTVIATIVVTFVRVTGFSSELGFYLVLAVSFPAIVVSFFAVIYRVRIVNRRRDKEEQIVSSTVAVENMGESVEKLEEYNKIVDSSIENLTKLVGKGDKEIHREETIDVVKKILDVEVKRAELVLGITEGVTRDSRPASNHLGLLDGNGE